jgi:hypothetical protein
MAATSFLAINQRAVQIDPTERYMIERQKAPNVIAARALVKSARGHAYWGDLDQKYTQIIEKKARAIYNAIFEPEDAQPESDMDLQPAGFAHTANGLRIALDLVNVTNEVKGLVPQPEDETGELTVRFIEKAHGVVKYIAGKDDSSLGLHPAVYFWGASGIHRPSVFLAIVSFFQEMILRDELVKFTMHRARLEEFLVGNSKIGNYLLKKHGGWKKSLTPVKRMFRTIIDGLDQGLTEDQIEEQLVQIEKSSGTSDYEMQTVDKKVWRETKNMLRHKASLESAQRCALCKARLVVAAASFDHKVKQSQGGSSAAENAQMTHHYCNSGFKEHFTQRGFPIPEISSPV